MKEFFKSWRRKVGCVTLLMACVAMAGWVKSYGHDDALNIVGHRLELSNGMLALGTPSLFKGVDTFCYVEILSIDLLQLAIPLTLISAFLLLTRPRQSNRIKITLPLAKKGA